MNAETWAARNDEVRDFRQVFLPYCLDPQPDGRYAVLNRNYKPVGFATADHVVYADHPVLIKIKLTKAQAIKLDNNSEGAPREDGRIYLYHDGCIPTKSAAAMKAYLARLEILAKLTVRWAQG